MALVTNSYVAPGSEGPLIKAVRCVLVFSCIC
jgi:hypothetical protein